MDQVVVTRSACVRRRDPGAARSGLAIIFGMMGVLNLAQGEFLMLGAYTVLVVAAAGGSVWLGILLAPLVVGSVGIVVERAIIRFLYGRPLDTMLATWGLSLALVGAVTLVYGADDRGRSRRRSAFTIGAGTASPSTGVRHRCRASAPWA